tara:strand:- start:311 stop:499 length:189 start_codon:yes stop_codon:yes gene_type:complete
MNKTKLDDLFLMEEYECVSINKEYLIISNRNRECIKIPMTQDLLIRLNKEIAVAILESNNDV